MEDRDYVYYIRVKDEWKVLPYNIRPYMKDNTKSIHKKHKAILDAYLLDNEVSIEAKYDTQLKDNDNNNIYEWLKVDDFIADYRDNLDYRLKEPETIQAPNSKPKYKKGDFVSINNEDYFTITNVSDKIEGKYYYTANGKDGIFNEDNLTPYKEKKEWYEDESNIGKIISYDCFDYTKLGILLTIGKESNSIWLKIVTLDGSIVEQKARKCRPATNQEIDQLNINHLQ